MHFLHLSAPELLKYEIAFFCKDNLNAIGVRSLYNKHPLSRTEVYKRELGDFENLRVLYYVMQADEGFL